MSGRERQKKEVHIKRVSHTHANKAKSLQRCRDPKNEHRDTERQAEKERYTHRHKHTDTQPQKYRYTTPTERERGGRDTESQRDTQACRMRDVQRQICTESSRQHSGETNRNIQEEEIHAGGVPPKSKLALFSTVHKTIACQGFSHASLIRIARTNTRNKLGGFVLFCFLNCTDISITYLW